MNSAITYTNVVAEATDRALSVFGVRIHLPTQGDEISLVDRSPSDGSAQDVGAELGIGPAKARRAR